MAFNYYETYRTEVEGGDTTLSFPMLRGASNVAGRNWVFFGDGRDDYKIFMPSFNVTKAKLAIDGEVEALIETGNPQPLRLRFIPLTPEYIREHPDRYDWITPSTLAQLDQPGMMSLFFTGLIPEWYVEQFGPPEELEDEASEE